MGGGSSAHSLSKEEAAALKSAVTEVPSLQKKLESLQAEAAEVATLRRRLQELEDAQKSSSVKMITTDTVSSLELPDSNIIASQELLLATQAEAASSKDKTKVVGEQASEAASSDEAAKETKETEDPEADKSAAAGCPDIHQAARKGNVAAVRHFLRLEPDCLEALDDVTLRPLDVAAFHGHLALVELLLARGAKLEKTGGPTALHWAAQWGHLHVVERLLAAGAAVEAEDNDGNTAYDRAKMRGQTEVMKRLEQIFVVTVALLSGRECRCKLSGSKSVLDLKKIAERELEITIKRLLNSEGETLNESDSLRQARVPGDALTAVN